MKKKVILHQADELVSFLKESKTTEFNRDIGRIKKYVRGEYAEGNSTLMETSTDSEVIAKYDSTADVVSGQVTNSFYMGILPNGIESVNVKLTIDLGEEAQNLLPQDEVQNILKTIETEATRLLRKELKKCNFKKTVLACARDFIDYGNTMSLVFFNNLDQIKCKCTKFDEIYIWNDDYIDTESILYIEDFPEFHVNNLFPQYNLAKSNTIPKMKKTTKTLFLDSYMNKVFKDSLSKSEWNTLTTTFHPPGGDWYKLVICDGEIIGYTNYKYKPYNVAKIDECAGNGYGRGDGLSAMGSILKANTSSGGEMISQIKIQAPNFFQASNCTVKSSDPNYASIDNFVDPRPGRNTIVSGKSGENAPLENGIGELLQQVSDPGKHLSEYTASHENSKMEVKEGYQTSAYVQNEPIPNEPIPAVINRLAQSIRSFKGKSDAFRDDMLLPMIKTILSLIYDMGKVEKRFVEFARQYEGLENFAEQNFIEVEISIKSTLNDMEKDLEKTNLERKTLQIGAIMNLRDPNSEDGGDVFKELLAETIAAYKTE